MTKSIIDMAREAGFNVKNFIPPVVTAQYSNGSWVSIGDKLERFATLHRAAIEKEIEHKIFEAAKRHNLTLCKTADGYTLMQLGIVTAQGEMK